MDLDGIKKRLITAIEARRDRNRETSYKALADAVGRTPERVRQWAAGKDLPPLQTIPKVCAALGIEPAYLLFNMKEEAPGTTRIAVSDDEHKLLQLYRLCSTDGKQQLLAMAEFLKQRNPIPDNVTVIR